MAEYHPEVFEIRRCPLKYCCPNRLCISEQTLIQDRQIQNPNPNPMNSQNPDQKPIALGPSCTVPLKLSNSPPVL